MLNRTQSRAIWVEEREKGRVLVLKVRPDQLELSASSEILAKAGVEGVLIAELTEIAPNSVIALANLGSWAQAADASGQLSEGTGDITVTEREIQRALGKVFLAEAIQSLDLDVRYGANGCTVTERVLQEGGLETDIRTIRPANGSQPPDEHRPQATATRVLQLLTKLNEGFFRRRLTRIVGDRIEGNRSVPIRAIDVFKKEAASTAAARVA